MQPEKIFKTLRERIIWLDLPPERILNLSELAASFGVSRTPVKEALILLQAEGWLLRNGAQFMVTPLSLNRIKETTEIRSVLEVQANVWALNRILPQELELLEAIGEKINESKLPMTLRDMVKLDFRFHQTLYQAAKNSQLAEMLNLQLSRYLRIWLSMPGEIEPKSFFFEAKEIIRAIAEKDEERLKEATLAHINKSIDQIGGYFNIG